MQTPRDNDGGDPAPGAVPADAFRAAMAHWATGVAIVAVRHDERVYATTATALTSASLDPPLVLVALGPAAQVLPFLHQGTTFGISILTHAQRRLASDFADPFPVGASPFPETGTPLIQGSLTTLACTVHDAFPAGDHRIVLGRVTATTPGPDDPPLIRFQRRYRTL